MVAKLLNVKLKDGTVIQGQVRSRAVRDLALLTNEKKEKLNEIPTNQIIKQPANRSIE